MEKKLRKFVITFVKMIPFEADSDEAAEAGFEYQCEKPEHQGLIAFMQEAMFPSDVKDNDLFGGLDFDIYDNDDDPTIH